MATIFIQVSAAEKMWLQRMAEFYGLSLSALILTYSFDQLEDTYDALMAESAYKHYYHAKNQSTVSMAQVLAEFGGDENKL